MQENLIICSDINTALLKYIDDKSIDIAITSPPYWGQRDYDVENQIGNEEDYNEYIAKLLDVFDNLKNKLTDKGIFYLNIGDKYISKYGNSPLGMIPYKLAFYMEKLGWILEDIIIWYKPNHMPSSIKNRFANTYEPIFVFAKNKKNYYSEYVKVSKEYTNVLEINTQPTKYKHFAVYPEKLIETLLFFLKDVDELNILDPFAGSGTTGKVVNDINFYFGKRHSCKLIEINKEYVKDIIIDRTNINNVIYDDEIIPFNIKKYKNFIINSIEKIKENSLKELSNLSFDYDNIFKESFIKIFDTKSEYNSFLNLFFNSDLDKKEDIICFIGAKQFDIDMIYRTSLLNENGWVIRNMLIVKNDSVWFPIFMIVADNKRIKYNFPYEKLSISHKTFINYNWWNKNFIGYKVVDNLRKNLEGYIINIESYYPNGMPKIVYVYWNDGVITKELVYDEENVNEDDIKFKCRFCNNYLIVYYNYNKIQCEYCGATYWDRENYPILELNDKMYFESEVVTNYFNIDFCTSNEIAASLNTSYNGKFLFTSKVNFGASPGARKSVYGEYFSVQRYYNVIQPLISDYLNIKLKQLKLKKSSLLNYFPDNYKHKIGHWFRKDMGGSLPIISDWMKLKEILNLEDSYTRYVCKTALKLQTVKHSNKGKAPEDYIDYNYLEKLFSVFKKI